MPEQPSAELVEFHGNVELSDVGFYELAAHLGPVGDDGRRLVLGPGNVESLELEADHDLGVHWSTEGGSFLVRLRVVLIGEMGEIAVGAQAEFKAPGYSQETVPLEIQEEYVNRVALMTLAPYVRSAVADLSGRVFRRTVTLDTVRPGDMWFRVEQAEGLSTPEV